jgi:phage baseplate assembly protein V
MRLDDMAKFLAPLKTRIANLFSRAVLNRLDDSVGMQVVQLELGDDVREGIEHFQEYGFTSVPLEGAEAAVAFVGGRRDHGIALVVGDRRYRLKGLQGGEVAMYTDQGDTIVIKRGGTIEVTAATKVKLSAPVVELAGNTEAAVNGTSYRAAEDTLLTALAAFCAAIVPTTGVPAPAKATVAAAFAAFSATSSTYLSTKVKQS